MLRGPDCHLNDYYLLKQSQVQFSRSCSQCISVMNKWTNYELEVTRMKRWRSTNFHGILLHFWCLSKHSQKTSSTKCWIVSVIRCILIGKWILRVHSSQSLVGYIVFSERPSVSVTYLTLDALELNMLTSHPGLGSSELLDSGACTRNFKYHHVSLEMCNTFFTG